MFKNLKQMNSLISEMRKLTNDPNALKDPQAVMDSMGINQEELEKQCNSKVETGIFGADMKISLLNDGPVTIIIDTQNKE
jgi:hypothetical protein